MAILACQQSLRPCRSTPRFVPGLFVAKLRERILVHMLLSAIGEIKRICYVAVAILG